MEERKEPIDILKTIEQEMDSDIHPILKKILDNIKPIGIAVGGIVVAVAVYTGVTSYQESQRNKAISELGSIMVMADENARIAKLESFSQSGPASLRPAAQLELASVFMAKGEYDKAANAWQALEKVDGMRMVAGLGQAKMMMRKGDYTQAVSLLSTLKKDAGEEFSSAVASTLAFAAEKAGQKDLAIAEYEFLKSKEPGNEAFLEFKIATLKAKS